MMLPAKVEVTAIVVTSDTVTSVRAIRDSEEDTCATYANSDVTLEQITEAALMLYKSNDAVGRVVRDYRNGQNVTLDGPAALLPSVGKTLVRIETRYLDWI